MPNIVEVVKRAALEAVAAGKPLEFMFGQVISASPLKIQVDQKQIYGERALLLTNAVQDHAVDVELSIYTENDSFMNGQHTHRITDTYTGGGSADSGNLDTTHKHSIKGRKKLLIHNGLQVGERVLLLRWQGGQKFMVLDRVSEHQTKGDESE